MSEAAPVPIRLSATVLLTNCRLNDLLSPGELGTLAATPVSLVDSARAGSTGADSFTVTADFPVDGTPPGENLASRFKPKDHGVWEMVLATPIANLPRGRLTVSVRDRQGNTSRIERTFSAGR